MSEQAFEQPYEYIPPHESPKARRYRKGKAACLAELDSTRCLAQWGPGAVPAHGCVIGVGDGDEHDGPHWCACGAETDQ